MPRNRGVRSEQWDTCQRCGREYPMSDLTRQDGLLLCQRRCWDARTVAQGDWEQARIMDVISSSIDEGSDTRYNDPVFFGEDFG